VAKHQERKVKLQREEWGTHLGREQKSINKKAQTFSSSWTSSQTNRNYELRAATLEMTLINKKNTGWW